MDQSMDGRRIGYYRSGDGPLAVQRCPAERTGATQSGATQPGATQHSVRGHK